ncbi:MAG: glutathione S-transferase [Alphaproteobacteria bacterium]|nr:glutathione S-transferase [Alphaproteobacteria bacterium]
MTDRYQVIGALSSPFSVKMRAIMRYRRLPHDWILNTAEVRERTRHVRPPIIPKVHFPEEPDDVWHVDSSPLAYTLEERHQGRSILPDDPAHAFLAHLLEDFGDEWGTKMMFHYRWVGEDKGGDTEYVSHLMLYPGTGPASDDELREAAHKFRDWQVPLWPVAGIEPQNVPLIETSFGRIVAAWDLVLRDQHFLFGSRPSLGDFGFYGQLYQCFWNPASFKVMAQVSKRIVPWLTIIDDASGVEGAWIDPDAAPCEGVAELLWLAGEVYLPYLDATARAIEAGHDRLEFTALGLEHSQKPMKYHARCLEVMREKLAALADGDRKKVERLLGETDAFRFLA